MQELPPYSTKAKVVQLSGLEAFWLDLPLPVLLQLLPICNYRGWRPLKACHVEWFNVMRRYITSLGPMLCHPKFSIDKSWMYQTMRCFDAALLTFWPPFIRQLLEEELQDPLLGIAPTCWHCIITHDWIIFPWYFYLEVIKYLRWQTFTYLHPMSMFHFRCMPDSTCFHYIFFHAVWLHMQSWITEVKGYLCGFVWPHSWLHFPLSWCLLATGNWAVLIYNQPKRNC